MKEAMINFIQSNREIIIIFFLFGLLGLYCFKQLKLHRLFLRVFADNAGAIRSYEKAGFIKEAYLKDDVRIQGQYKDIVLMGILNPED